MGIISGYPVGAKIIAKFRETNLCTKEEGERLLAFTNNSGPLFIVGTVGVSLIGSTAIGIILLITHIFASLTVGIIFRFWKRNKDILKKTYPSTIRRSADTKQHVNFSNLGEILSTSIMQSISTIVMIGGFIMLFSIIISILHNSQVLHLINYSIYPILHLFNIPINFASGITTGIIELTNGLKAITTIPIKELSKTIITCSFLLGFGGISVLLQVLSIISKTDISIKSYILGKLLHACIAALYTFLFFLCFPFFSLNI
ncbi:MAG: sporulation integral membrane protein YlbJ [Oscillospiraceae bacterium]|nr:sporulation integral membrane protein YlbJ [Oscillospiraceae bacterium]